MGTVDFDDGRQLVALNTEYSRPDRGDDEAGLRELATLDETAHTPTRLPAPDAGSIRASAQALRDRGRSAGAVDIDQTTAALIAEEASKVTQAEKSRAWLRRVLFGPSPRRYPFAEMEPYLRDHYGGFERHVTRRRGEHVVPVLPRTREAWDRFLDGRMLSDVPRAEWPKLMIMSTDPEWRAVVIAFAEAARDRAETPLVEKGIRILDARHRGSVHNTAAFMTLTIGMKPFGGVALDNNRVVPSPRLTRRALDFLYATIGYMYGPGMLGTKGLRVRKGANSGPFTFAKDTKQRIKKIRSAVRELPRFGTLVTAWEAGDENLYREEARIAVDADLNNTSDQGTRYQVDDAEWVSAPGAERPEVKPTKRRVVYLPDELGTAKKAEKQITLPEAVTQGMRRRRYDREPPINIAGQAENSEYREGMYSHLKPFASRLMNWQILLLLHAGAVAIRTTDAASADMNTGAMVLAAQAGALQEECGSSHTLAWLKMYLNLGPAIAYGDAGDDPVVVGRGDEVNDQQGRFGNRSGFFGNGDANQKAITSDRINRRADAGLLGDEATPREHVRRYFADCVPSVEKLRLLASSQDPVALRRKLFPYGFVEVIRGDNCFTIYFEDDVYERDGACLAASAKGRYIHTHEVPPADAPTDFEGNEIYEDRRPGRLGRTFLVAPRKDSRLKKKLTPEYGIDTKSMPFTSWTALRDQLNRAPDGPYYVGLLGALLDPLTPGGDFWATCDQGHQAELVRHGLQDVDPESPLAEYREDTSKIDWALSEEDIPDEEIAVDFEVLDRTEKEQIIRALRDTDAALPPFPRHDDFAALALKEE